MATLSYHISAVGGGSAIPATPALKGCWESTRGFYAEEEDLMNKAILFLYVTIFSVGAADYYVDSELGNDDSSGVSRQAAWKSLERITAMVFEPGDNIYLRRGCHWTGNVQLRGSGAEGNPITVGAYGDGNGRPVINGNGYSGTHDVPVGVVYIENEEYWVIRDLEVTNNLNDERTFSHGILARNFSGGARRDIHIRDCYLHDISVSDEKRSCENKDKYLGGIRVKAFGDSPSWWDGVLIENNVLERPGRCGIATGAGFGHPDESPYRPNLNVVIRGNKVSYTEGDGIIAVSCLKPLIEHNTVAHCGGITDYSAGIWCWQTKNALFQYNEAYGCHDPKSDGTGFDADYNSYGTVFQYNYSHDNEGGFLLVMRHRDNSPNKDITIRYNISVNDGRKIIHGGGGASSPQNLTVHNNIFVLRESGQKAELFATNFFNNIIYAPGDNVDWQISVSDWSDYNCYYGAGSPPEEPHSIYEDPLFVDLGFSDTGFAGLSGYRLSHASPCIDAGFAFDTTGGPEVDFEGNSLFHSTPDMGAFEISDATIIMPPCGTKSKIRGASNRPSLTPWPVFGSVGSPSFDCRGRRLIARERGSFAHSVLIIETE